MTREEAIKFSEYAQLMTDGKPDVQEFYKIAEAALREQEAVTNRNGLTNAQYIRSMTDEELASEIMCPYSIEPDLCNSVKTCNECCLEWLKQPYKEDA